MYIKAEIDSETSAGAGAAGTFQVISIEDDDGNDLTDKIDCGHHYQSGDELKADLEKIFGEEVDLDI